MAGIVHFDAGALPCSASGSAARRRLCACIRTVRGGFWGFEHAKKQPYMRYLQPGEQCKLRFGSN
jgi:hypothetical protein